MAGYSVGRRTDNPIEGIEDDRLQRASIAKSFVGQVLDLDATRGLAVGVFGPWGSGKTSFVNLARRVLERTGIPTLDFNPWMFNGEEQLVVRFFGEVSASLGQQKELRNVAQAIAKYGGAVAGVASIASTVLGVPALTQVGAVIKLTGRRKGVRELRKSVEAGLRERKRPIVVVLDDVDRLTFPEIRQVFKLVRLTASFPNLIYIVVCDRHRVEQALNEQSQGNDGFGRKYVEKIIQFPFDLPAVPQHLLRSEFEEALTDALVGVDPAPFETAELWPSVYADIIDPLIRNLRDVRRYATAVRGTAADLAGEVEMADLLGLEAIRLFLPAVFRKLHDAVDAITYPADSRSDERGLRELRYGGTNSNPRHKEEVQDLVDAGVDHPDVVEAMLRTLFPYGHWYLTAADETAWNSDAEEGNKVARRVADEAILRLYLERLAGTDIGVLRAAEKALRSLGSAGEFESFLRSVDSEEIVDVVRDFCRLSHRFEPTHATKGVAVLLNLLPEMPSGSFLRRSRPVVRATVLQLMRAVGSPGAVAAATEKILPKLKTLAAKCELLLLIGHSRHKDERIVTVEVSQTLDTALAEDIRRAFERDAIDEPEEYAWVLSFPARVGESLDLPDSPGVAFRLAHSAFSIAWSDTGETRSLDWGFLGRLYGDEETTVARMRTLYGVFDGRTWAGQLEQWGISGKEAKATIEMVRRSLPSVGRPPPMG